MDEIDRSRNYGVCDFDITNKLGRIFKALVNYDKKT